MPVDSTPVDKPLRRDAERNRQRIIDAARIVFAERGLRGSHDDIAREAGVGVGTVYRRFPDKQQLVDALFEERIEEMVDLVEKALAAADAWTGLRQFVLAAQELQVADRGLRELLLGAEGGAERVQRARRRIAPVMETLLARAQAEGTVRGDLALTDIATLQLAVGAIAEATREIAPDAWRRTLAVMLAGIRTGGEEHEEFTTAPLSLEQFERAMHVSTASAKRDSRA